MSDFLRYVFLAEQIAAAIEQAKAQGKPGVFEIVLRPAGHPAADDEVRVASVTV